MKVLTLSEIWIYPVKSLGGIQMKSAKVMPKGLEHDRRWMLVNDERGFMTQRDYPKMALLKLSFGSDGFIVTSDKDTLHIPFNMNAQKQTVTKVWDDTVTTLEAGSHYNSWFSDILDVKCKLVQFPEINPRPVDAQYKINNDHVSLADGFPFLIIGQSSLNDLNIRLTTPVPMNRFRPNLVFTGGDPYEEDNWRNFSVGANKFVGVKPCSRCVMTTINQDTAEKNAEPLKTLAAYRRQNNKIYFGQNVIAVDFTEIFVGDTILLN